jgi:hypothetical protein
MSHSRIHKNFTFLAAIHFEDRFMVNLYEMDAKMDIYTEDQREQNIAVERVTYLLGSVVEDCLFISIDEKDAINKYNNAGMKVCTLPEDPFDQMVGLALLNKCNAIMEGKIVMTDIVFGSKLSNLIKFELNHEVAKLEFDGKHWYNEPTLVMADKFSKKDKIVNLFDHKCDTWEDLGLTWEET